MLQHINEFFNEIYDDTFDDIRRYIAVKCQDPSYISDIVQDTYLEFYNLILKKGEAYVLDYRALLFKIAKRKVYRYYSLREKLRVILPIYQVNCDGEEYSNLEDMEDDTFEDDVISSMESERIWSIISGYPADVRKIFHLFFYEEMSHSQIAKELNCSLSNVKNKIYRTLDEIRQKGRNDD